MRHLKFFITIITLGALASPGYAQIQNPKDVAKKDATQKANSAENSTIDQGLNKAEGAIKGLFGKKKAAPATAQPAAAPATPAQPATQAMQAANTDMQQQGPISAYNNYDFVPGDQILFEDHFADDRNGEFPSHWHLSAGQAVMNTAAGQPSLLLTQGNFAHVSPLIKSAAYLGAAFTIEFDSYTQGGYGPHLYFYNSTADAAAAMHDQAQVDICSGNIWSGVTVTNKKANLLLNSDYPADLARANYKNKWHHIAMAFKNNQLKVYVDQYRVMVVPDLGVAPKAFDIEGIGDANNPVIISNVKVANGGDMNMLGKKFTDAKLITHGINFDVDQATIKPESMGTLNMIVGILKDNPDLKFEIDGHTDNSGAAAHNAALSQQRADAVKTQLVSMGVDAGRLTTKGFGDSKPISPNTTPEGKANNRRVEFVKK